MTTLNAANDYSREQLLDMLRAEQAKNVALKKAGQGRVTCKPGKSGGLCAYGFGKYPVTLYKSQWRKLIDNIAVIEAGLAAHDSELSNKGE